MWVSRVRRMCGGEDILSVESCSSRSSQVLLLTHNSLGSGEFKNTLGIFFSPDSILMFVVWMYFSHTSTLVSTYQITSNATRINGITALLAAPASTRPRSYLFPQGEVWVLNCLAQPLSDSYRLWCYLLAALHGSQDGCISSIFSLMSEIKLYAWQSVPKWIPLLPAGISEVCS